MESLINQAKAFTRRCRFGFNGQERDNSVYGEGNAYTAAFWEYDPRLGRRWNMDPKANFYQSPYTCLRNNPIKLVDPYGDEIQGDKAAFEKAKTSANEKLTKVKNEITDINKKIEEAKAKNENTGVLEKKKLKLEQKQKEWEGVLQEYSALENSKQVYNIITGVKNGPVFNDLPAGAGGVTRFNKNTGAVDILIVDRQGGSDLEELVHELKHAYQFENGQISFNYETGKAGSLYDIQDEVEGYQRAKLFGMYPGQKIDEAFVRQQGYASRQPGPLDINSQDPIQKEKTRGDLIKSDLHERAKRGKAPDEIIINWQNYYKP